MLCKQLYSLGCSGHMASAFHSGLLKIYDFLKTELNLFQGCLFYYLESQADKLQMYVDAMVWYFVFIIFVMYCIMPMPFKWCITTCIITSVTHILCISVVNLFTGLIKESTGMRLWYKTQYYAIPYNTLYGMRLSTLGYPTLEVVPMEWWVMVPIRLMDINPVTPKILIIQLTRLKTVLRGAPPCPMYF